ncbi:MAG: 3-oxoacyl-ACP reductase FabG [Thermodesulfobacteriota bacterium]
MLLEGKAAVITGGSQGFGYAMAEEFCREGAGVAIVNRTREKGEEAAAKLRESGGRAMAVQCDTVDASQVEAMLAAVREAFGGVHILVNNAGIIRPAMIFKMKPEEWDMVVNTNLTGYFNCIRSVAGIMMEQKGGRILNISSVAGERGTIGQANYGAAKAGVHGLTKSAAKELSRYGITVNAIAAGLFKTPMSDRMPADLKQKAIEEIPLKRMGEPWELAKLAAFLVSDNAAYITGQIIGINGGIHM